MEEPVNTYPMNSGLIVGVRRDEADASSFSVSLGLASSHSMTLHLISNRTFDFLLSRSERNEDTKGLWREAL